MSWQSTVKIFYYIQQPSLNGFVFCLYHNLADFPFIALYEMSPLQIYLLFTLNVGASMINIAKFCITQFTYSELFSDESHYIGIQLQLTFSPYSYTSFIQNQHLSLVFVIHWISQGLCQVTWDKAWSAKQVHWMLIQEQKANCLSHRLWCTTTFRHQWKLLT